MSDSPTQRVSSRELSVLAAFLIPLGILAVAVAYIPLDAYGNPDPRAFVTRSLQISRDLTTVTTIQDPPLRYTPLVAIYSVIEPPARQAAAIGSAFGAISVYVVSPLAMWAFARRVAGSRVAFLALLGLLGNIVFFSTEHWMRPLAAWQYYVALPWIFVSLASADWTLSADLRQSRRRRAIVTGLLIAAVGLTQVLFAGLTAIIIAVACLLRRRVQTLIEIGLTGLPFAGYYLLSPVAREQILQSIGGRTASEPLFPISLREIVFIAVVIVGIAIWYRERSSISPVVGAGLLVVGPIWAFAVLTSGEYLSYFFPVLAVPLMLTGLAAGGCAVFDRHISRLAIGPRRAYADGGFRVVPWRILIPVLTLIAIGLTVVLLDSVLPG